MDCFNCLGGLLPNIKAGALIRTRMILQCLCCCHLRHSRSDLWQFADGICFVINPCDLVLGCVCILNMVMGKAEAVSQGLLQHMTDLPCGSLLLRSFCIRDFRLWSPYAIGHLLLHLSAVRSIAFSFRTRLLGGCCYATCFCEPEGSADYLSLEVLMK